MNGYCATLDNGDVILVDAHNIKAALRIAELKKPKGSKIVRII